MITSLVVRRELQHLSPSLESVYAAHVQYLVIDPVACSRVRLESVLGLASHLLDQSFLQPLILFLQLNVRKSALCGSFAVSRWFV